MNMRFARKIDSRHVFDLILTHELHEYSKYPFMDKGKLRKYIFNQVANLMKDNNSRIIVYVENYKVIGLVTLTRLLWDTRHFGFGMGKIGYFIGEGSYPRSIKIKKDLLQFIFKLCRDWKFRHLSCRMHAKDIASAHVLEGEGFRIMDTFVTYVSSKACKKGLNIKDLYKVRIFKKRDLLKLVRLAKTNFSANRFYRDHRFESNKASELYGEWIKNYCYGRGGGKVIISEDSHKDAVGFLAYKLNADWAKVGYKVIGEGLAVVSPEAKGSFPSLVKEINQLVPHPYDYAEFDTRLDNFEAIKVYQKFGFTFAKAKHTFHKWLDS